MAPRLVPAVALLAILAGAAVASAPGPHQPSGDWASLDRELDALAGLASGEEPALRAGALLKTGYSYFEDSPIPGASGGTSGFALDNVRPWLAGEVGDATLEIELEARDGTARLLDAFARRALGDHVDATFGLFQTDFLRSGSIAPEGMLFLLRTRPGQYWQDARDEGLQLAARLDEIGLCASLQNGGDSAGEDLAYTVRAEYDAIGEGAPPVEGAYGSGRTTCLSLGAAFHDDASAAGDGDAVAVDLAATMDRFALSAEWLDFAADGGGGSGVYQELSNTSPWAVSASFMIDADRFELAVRFEDWDVAPDVSALTVGVNRYVEGHDLMWIVNYRLQESDLASQDGDAFGIGLTVDI